MANASVELPPRVFSPSRSPRHAGVRRCPAPRVQAVARPSTVNAVAAPAEPLATVSTKRATVSKEQGEDLYKDMYLGRLFEDTCAQMYYRGKMFGFVHLYCGQEAVSTGVIRLLEERDYVCSTYRDHVHALSKGVHPNAVCVPPLYLPAAPWTPKTDEARLYSCPKTVLSCLCGWPLLGHGRAVRQGHWRVPWTGRIHAHVLSRPWLRESPITTYFAQYENPRSGSCRSSHKVVAPCCLQLGGFAFIGEGIPIGLGAAFQSRYRKVDHPFSSFSSPLASRVVPPNLYAGGCCLLGCQRSHGAVLSCLIQDVLGEEGDMAVTCSFFGDGTCNVGTDSHVVLTFPY